MSEQPTRSNPRRRRRGTGTIDRLPDGRWSPRLPTSIGRGRLEPCATYEAAEALLDAALAEIAERNLVHNQTNTLRGWGARWMDDREISGVEDIKSDRSRWRRHIETAVFIDWPIASIRSLHVRDWLAEMLRKSAAPGRGYRTAPERTLGKQTVKNTLNLLRCCLESAMERELIRENPAQQVHLPRAKRKDRRTFDPWTYLMPEEQERLLSCQRIPEEDRDLIAFALWTGVRVSEQWNLELRDVHLQVARPYVVIRFGKKDRSTKSGKIRRVPLFGLALEATQRQVARLADPGKKNSYGLLWPSPRGERRQTAEAPRHWKKHLAVAGIFAEQRHDRRPVRWHDLRHTCASSLVAGWRGRRWTLEEVKGLLGHSDISVTQRYTHLADSALDAAARETHRLSAWADRSAHSQLMAPDAALVSAGNPSAPPARIELATFGLGNRCSIH
uniref:Tyr recombinase domain-containing protein n=1 Tax=Sorangium cellulosum TaxID=56 RepID=A0A3S5GYB6_SORCE|nr:hypothetical protein [Sorangium cellulosum]